MDVRSIYAKYSFVRLCAEAGVREDFSEPVEETLTRAFARLAAIDAAVKGMPDYGSKFDLIVASLDAIKAEALGTDQAGIASKIAGVTDAINDLVDEMNSGNTSAAGHRT